MRTIEWRHDGQRLVVPATIYPPAAGAMLEGVEARALIDTGATITGVTQRIARQLGIRSIGKRLISTVGGDRHVNRYIFRVGLSGTDEGAPAFPYVFEDVIGIELLDNFSFDALLGMDILRQCELLVAPPDLARLRFG